MPKSKTSTFSKKAKPSGGKFNHRDDKEVLRVTLNPLFQEVVNALYKTSKELKRVSLERDHLKDILRQSNVAIQDDLTFDDDESDDSKSASSWV